MKALEHLVIEEIAHIRALESRLHTAWRNLSEESMTGFLTELADLEHRTARVDRMLDVLALPERAAA